MLVGSAAGEQQIRISLEIDPGLAISQNLASTA